MLQSSVDLMLLQHLIHFGVKRMTRRLGNLVGAHPQTFLLRLTLTHRHAFMTSKTFWRSHGLDFYHGLLGCRRCALVRGTLKRCGTTLFFFKPPSVVLFS